MQLRDSRYQKCSKTLEERSGGLPESVALPFDRASQTKLISRPRHSLEGPAESIEDVQIGFLGTISWQVDLDVVVKFASQSNLCAIPQFLIFCRFVLARPFLT